MTITTVDPTRSDFARDRWQRPLVMQADGRRIPYVRASAAAKTVEDHWNLEMWARRNVAFGLARDASLVARVLAMGGDPSTWDLDAKGKVNAICDDATTVAQAHRAADIGTSLHRLTEMTDRGMPVVAGPYEADIEAYVNALIDAGFEIDPSYIECHLVCDALQMAGTADRILVRSADRLHLIADLKTGSTVDYGALGWAAQLAAYAHGTLYDVDAEERLPTPAIDKVTGIVIHLPAGQGTCTLYEVDLVAGYRAAELANEIRSTRLAAKRWMRPLSAVPAEAVARHPAGGGRRASLLDRYRALDGLRQIAFRARGINPDDLDAIAAALDEIEPHPVDPERLATDEVQAVMARLMAITPEARATLDALAREALETGVSISARFEPFERNVALCAALADWATASLHEPTLRALVAVVSDDETIEQPTIPLGAALAALSVGQARALAEMTAAL